MKDDEIKSNLCYYDLRNPDGISIMANDPESYGLDMEEFKKYGNYPQTNCACDNCFYGRAKLAEEIIKILEKL